MKTITVSDKGVSTIKFNTSVPFPEKTKRTRETGKYPFNEMPLGTSLPLEGMPDWDQKDVAAARQAFNSDVYAPARGRGYLASRNMAKHGGTGFRVWLLEHTDETRGTNPEASA